MAESEFVSAAQFGEFVKRMQDRFDRVDERFDHANELAGERHARLREDMQEMKADIRQMRNWVVTLFTVVVFGFVGAIVLRVFFSS